MRGHERIATVVGEAPPGHEFHRTVVDPVSGAAPGWLVEGRPVGFGHDTLHASYLHVHWAGHPQLAQRFANAVHAYAAPDPAGPPAPSPSSRYKPNFAPSVTTRRSRPVPGSPASARSGTHSSPPV